MTVRRVALAVVALAVGAAALFLAMPARAEYCEAIEWPNARNPDGGCERLFGIRMDWGRGRTQVNLMVENEARGAVSAAREAELRRMLEEVVGGVGNAVIRLGGVEMPETGHLVIVNMQDGWWALDHRHSANQHDGKWLGRG